MVDIQGAVNKPGVYKMPNGSRIEDLLNASEGIAEGADNKWIEVNLNRAKKVSDGEKIYIPTKNDQSLMSNVQSKLVNINAATQKELESIAGIGAVTAEKIINGRPYQELAELVSRKIISAKLYTQIKDLLSVW
jgi:competence protein ComEA